VAYRDVRGEKLPVCPECERHLIELKPREQEEEPSPAFLPRLAASPLYPFSKGARIGLAASIALFAAIWAAAWGLSRFVAELTVPVSIFILVLSVAFFWLYLVQTIEDTALGRPARAWPDFENMFESMVTPLVSAVVLLVGCFLPAIIYASVKNVRLESWSSDGVFTGLVTLGIVLMPMALLATSLLRTPWAMRPVFLLRSIFTVPLHHFAACVLPVGLFWLVVKDAPYVSQVPAYRDFPFYIAGGVYLLMVEAHIIGLVYLSGRHRLGWFEKAPPKDGT
jgi:hypothetical protein